MNHISIDEGNHKSQTASTTTAHRMDHFHPHSSGRDNVEKGTDRNAALGFSENFQTSSLQDNLSSQDFVSNFLEYSQAKSNPGSHRRLTHGRKLRRTGSTTKMRPATEHKSNFVVAWKDLSILCKPSLNRELNLPHWAHVKIEQGVQITNTVPRIRKRQKNHLVPSLTLMPESPVPLHGHSPLQRPPRQVTQLKTD